MSGVTSTWPSQCGPAPMPIVGIGRASRDLGGVVAGHAFEHDREGPGLGDGAGLVEDERRRRAGPCSRRACRTDCGVRPTWPITGIPASTSARIVSAEPPAPFELHGLALGFLEEPRRRGHGLSRSILHSCRTASRPRPAPDSAARATISA